MTLIEMINADFCLAEVQSISLMNKAEKVQVDFPFLLLKEKDNRTMFTTILNIDLKLVKK